MKDHVNVLLMGDDGVGKSSLMISIMCNYFPQNVKAVLADAMIPTACNANNTCITLMDSSAESGERENLKQKILLADSIVLLFDVTRLDTLHNINEIWIPLILELQPGKPLFSLKPAIIVGTKIDLVTDSAAVEEEFVISIMERYPFIAEYMHCSALKLKNIHEVINSGESIVLCPIAPIYDVVRHEFTWGCRQVFQRIFRILDLDHDNLLNDFEISNSQLQCFNLEITQEDVNVLKGKIGEQVPGGLYNNALTFEGFLGLMTAVSDFLIPWTILGHYGYTAQDDQFILHIPTELQTIPKIAKDQIYELSEDAKEFLLGLAHNAYQENTRPINPDSDNQSELEDCLTSEALRWILSVLPSDIPNPWSNPPEYRSIWSHHNEHIKQIQQSIVLPGFPHEGAILTFANWLTQWNLLALSDPLFVQNLLFRLGYVDYNDNGIVPSSTTLTTLLKRRQTATQSAQSSSSWLFPSSIADIADIAPRQTMNVYVLGDNHVGKSSFIFAMSGLRPPGKNVHEDLEKGAEYTKPTEAVVIGGYVEHATTRDVFPGTTSARRGKSLHAASSSSFSVLSSVTNPYYIALTSVPLEYMAVWNQSCTAQCDLVLLMYQCNDMKSLHTAMDLEKILPKHLPRLYVASKMDLLHHPQNPILSNNPTYEKILQKITLHTQEQQLLPVLPVSSTSHDGMKETMSAIKAVIQRPEIGIPKKEEKILYPYYQQPLFIVSATLSIVSLSVLLLKYNQEIKRWVEEWTHQTSSLWWLTKSITPTATS